MATKGGAIRDMWFHWESNLGCPAIFYLYLYIYLFFARQVCQQLRYGTTLLWSYVELCRNAVWLWLLLVLLFTYWPVISCSGGGLLHLGWIRNRVNLNRLNTAHRETCIRAVTGPLSSLSYRSHSWQEVKTPFGSKVCCDWSDSSAVNLWRWFHWRTMRTLKRRFHTDPVVLMNRL